MARNPLLSSGTAGLDLIVNYAAFYDAIGSVQVYNQATPPILGPINFTGYQHIEVQVRANAGDPLPLATFNDTLRNLVFLQPMTLGQFQFLVTPLQMDILVPGFYVYDLFVTDSLGRPKKWTGGNFTVVARGAIK